MIIFSKSFPGGTYRFDGPDDAVNTKSDSFFSHSWMKKVFVKYCGLQRPVLLFVDGHASHINLSVIDLVCENVVNLFVSPHTLLMHFSPLMCLFSSHLNPNLARQYMHCPLLKKDFVVSKWSLHVL